MGRGNHCEENNVLPAGVGERRSERTHSPIPVDPDIVKPRRRSRGRQISMEINEAMVMAEREPTDKTHWHPNLSLGKNIVYGEDPDSPEDDPVMLDLPETYIDCGDYGIITGRELYEERREAARILGHQPAYGTSAFINPNQRFRESAQAISEWIEAGFGLVHIYGDPGEGKDTLIEWMSEIMHMPIVVFEGGENVSMLEWIGGPGLVPHSDDKNTVSVTGVDVGDLTKAAQYPCFIVLDECVEGNMVEQLTMLHSAFGNHLGPQWYVDYDRDEESGEILRHPNGEPKIVRRSKRFIRVAAPGGETKVFPVHPDTVFFCTWNPGRGDLRPKDSTWRRGLQLRFISQEYDESDPTQKAAYEQWMRNEKETLYSMVANQLLGPNPVWKRLVEMGALTAESMEPVAKLKKEFVNLYKTREDDIPTRPAQQAFAMFVYDIVRHCENIANAGDDAQVVDLGGQVSRKALNRFKSYFSAHVDEQTINDTLEQQLLQDDQTPMHEMIQSIYNGFLRINSESDAKMEAAEAARVAGRIGAVSDAAEAQALAAEAASHAEAARQLAESANTDLARSVAKKAAEAARAAKKAADKLAGS